MLEIKETGEDTVERIVAAKVLTVVIGKLSAKVKPDFVDHAPEVNEASYLSPGLGAVSRHNLAASLGKRNVQDLAETAVHDQPLAGQRVRK